MTSNQGAGVNNADPAPSYEGPNEIGYAQFPGRGATYHFKVSGHDIQIYITEKRKLVRVHVDHEEWAPA